MVDMLVGVVGATNTVAADMVVEMVTGYNHMLVGVVGGAYVAHMHSVAVPQDLVVKAAQSD